MSKGFSFFVASKKKRVGATSVGMLKKQIFLTYHFISLLCCSLSLYLSSFFLSFLFPFSFLCLSFFFIAWLFICSIFPSLLWCTRFYTHKNRQTHIHTQIHKPNTQMNNSRSIKHLPWSIGFPGVKNNRSSNLTRKLFFISHVHPLTPTIDRYTELLW